LEEKTFVNVDKNVMNFILLVALTE